MMNHARQSRLYWISVSITLVLFAIMFWSSRSIFLEIPAVGVSPDSIDYLKHATEIRQGELPQFQVRTAGYPLLLAAFLEVFDGNLQSVVIAQMTVMMGACLLLIFIAARHLGWFYLLITFSISATILTPDFIEYEARILTEALFCSLLVLWFASFLEFIFKPNPAKAVTLGILLGLVIITRPAGLFLVPIFAFLVAQTWLADKGLTNVVALTLSFPITICAYATYNYFTLGHFELTSESGRNLCYATASLVDQSPDYSNEMNGIIAQTRDYFAENAPTDAYQSNNLRNISEYFEENYLTPTQFRGRCNRAHRSGNEDLKREFSTAAINAITENPIVYTKIVIANMRAFFLKPSSYRIPQKNWLRQRADAWRNDAYEQRYQLRERFNVNGSVDDVLPTAPGWLRRVEGQVYSFLNNILIKNNVYLWIFTISLIALLGLAIQPLRNLHNPYVVSLMVCVLIILGKNMLVSLVEPPLHRYTYLVTPFYLLAGTFVAVISARYLRKRYSFGKEGSTPQVGQS